MSSLLDESLGDAIRDPRQTVTFSVKPLQPTAMTGSQTAATPTPGVQSQLTAQQQAGLTRNPQLAGTNPDRTDAAYEAQLAKLRNQFGGEYAAILRDLGVMGEGGFLPGLIETEAARRQADLQTGMTNASQGVNEAALRGGTFFSGRRAFNLSQAQDPFTRDLARLTTDTSSALGQRLEDLMRLMDSFGIDRNVLLAELAQRLAAGIQQQPSGVQPESVLGSTNPGVIAGRVAAGIPNDANSYYDSYGAGGSRIPV